VSLLGYALADLIDEHGIHSVGIAALRWRRSVEWPVEALLRELSGRARSLAEWRARFAAVLLPDLVDRALKRQARRTAARES
jgi:hypothetical protein